ncbi:MAG: darA [Clostridiales bacterium]|jgi:uncharacterized protein YaaQ|nr:darA [Clostridiales bacterium]
MKLILTVVHDDDAGYLMEKLTNAGFYATKLASTGGFLKVGNTTLFIGTSDDKVEEVINIIKDVCKSGKQMTLLNQPMTTMPEGYMSYPIEVEVGGATIFVIEVNQFLKI